MKDEGGRHGNHSRRLGGRVTKGRLWEALVSLCRNKVMLCHVPLKTLELLTKQDRKIARQLGSKGPLLPGNGREPNDIQIPTTAF